jgi:hypothetical protein
MGGFLTSTATGCGCRKIVAIPAHAQELPTLKRVKKKGKIPLGHKESSIPFSYRDDKQQAIGYPQLQRAQQFLAKILLH